MKAFVLPNLLKNNCYETVANVCRFILSHGSEIFMQEIYKDFFSDLGKISFLSEKECAELCDVIIAVGGDGTILSACPIASEYRKKLLGINCGRLGFMATLEHDELDLLSKLFDKNFTVEKRHMLDIKINRGNETQTLQVLNDAVISKPARAKIASFTVKKGDVTVSHLRADGIIFSTPTGATAYSLSAGGPILEPGMDCFEFTPICPHTLMSRTMIFSKDTELSVAFSRRDDPNAAFNITADGKDIAPVSASDTVKISLSDKYIELIDIKGGSFFKSVTDKLMRPLKESGEE